MGLDQWLNNNKNREESIDIKNMIVAQMQRIDHGWKKTENERRKFSISNVMMKIWSVKDSCFFYNAKFTPNHRCNKQIHIITVLNHDLLENVEEEIKENIFRRKLMILEVCLNLLEDIDSNWPLYFKGKVGNQIMLVSIDTRATHNFASLVVVSILKLGQKHVRFQYKYRHM